MALNNIAKIYTNHATHFLQLTDDNEYNVFKDIDHNISHMSINFFRILANRKLNHTL